MFFKYSHLVPLQNCLGAYVWRDHGVEMVCVMVMMIMYFIPIVHGHDGFIVWS